MIRIGFLVKINKETNRHNDYKHLMLYSGDNQTHIKSLATIPWTFNVALSFFTVVLVFIMIYSNTH